MDNKDTKWCYSLDKESFNGCFDTKNEAIQEGRECAIDYNKTCIYIGEAVNYFIPSIDVDWVIERIQEDAYDDGGEWADDYLKDISQEQIDELDERLNEVLSDWIKKHGIKQNWYNVENIERVEL